MRAAGRASNRFVLAIDQGTTSTRAIVYDAAGQLVSVVQREHRQLYPAAGRVEHDANEVRRTVEALIGRAITAAGIDAGQVVGIGIANQRETTVLWDRRTGRPVGNAIVWQDTRTDDLVARLAARPEVEQVGELSGLPLLGYFAAPRIRWLLDRDERLRAGAERGDILFGTMDSWLIWNLTGGAHVTDVSNAGRTMLMNLHTLDWDQRLLEFFDIPTAMLPEIRSSAEVYGHTIIEPSGIPIAAALGDQQAALFGQTCFAAGETKCTYGTGAFLLSNTGTAPVRSRHGLLTTVAFRLGDQPAHYALEGSIAATGSLVQWLRDRLGLIDSAPEIETLANTVTDNGGCSVVPAFSGLFAPRWRAEARGVIAGLTSYITRGHLARAVLEATAWQTREVVDALDADTGHRLTELRVDGGMTSNNLLMQQISDALGVPVQRPLFAETVSLGAAYAAGLAVGMWPDMDGLRRNRHIAGRWEPTISAADRDRGYRQWSRAAAMSYDWAGDR
ncbi:glycerol kinase GlpK [Nocardia cyriacigeorgica]|uniref:glycerol kinase GlpK n=1 Tax=Nocardia cyriacigeorgica TaxID=135487 RepID=UPI00189526B5|nr:glycerol kinase GlpK [Nocardia cyriacigeorgica]MBF6094757.1 glycerol kinase GlpK [Nocardia cyriacigeorgica]MBF6162369.1 glycerol kinase GlpK [Nocardia cyriacigeorgica]MBF6201328.1 glycerol kinase GlpK [Nocardia cyriacigeorgica]MBF6320747.1 glycerol kinase GlpK [Nocardia cyriacigeorgica]MBF6399247.1 glycerol kinase GlpK [Nocardia cyriacigeorgica]